MVGFFLILTILASYIVYISHKLNKYLILIILPVIVTLHCSTFIVQRDNYIKAAGIQKYVIQDVISKYNRSNYSDKRNAVILGNVPQYLNENFNDETIWSDEVSDFGIALNLNSEGNLNGIALTKRKIDSKDFPFERVVITDTQIVIDKYFSANIKDLWYYEYNLDSKESYLIKIKDKQDLEKTIQLIVKENINSPKDARRNSLLDL